MTNPANLLERVVDEHLQQHPHNPHEHALPTLRGSILEQPRVVGWFSMRDYYDKAAAENWEPCVVQFPAVINGEQLVTLRGI
jgi:hypothetical protein